MELKQLTDPELHARLRALAAQERESVADVVEHLTELERRDTVADTGCGTIFDYCVRVLRYSEAGAFSRIRAARAAITAPGVIEGLRSGSVSLETVMRLAPVLTPENGEGLLVLASGATKREVQSIVASLGGEEPASERDVVRILPAAMTTEIIAPPARVRMSFTADPEFLQMVETLRSLRRHAHPAGRLEDLLKEAVASWLEQLRPAPARPSPPAKKRFSRRIPAAVKRAVWERDGGRCVFMGPSGTRCERRDFLQYDHITPWSQGGPSDLQNVRLLCRPHNLRLARKCFGARVPPRRMRVRPATPAYGLGQKSQF